MSLERVIKALVDLGLPRVDAEVYVYLTKNGPLGAIDIAEKLKLNKKRLEVSIQNLREKAVIKSTNKLSIEFSAVSFEEALSLLIEISRKQTEALNEIKKEVLSSWKGMKKSSEKN